MADWMVGNWHTVDFSIKNKKTILPLHGLNIKQDVPHFSTEKASKGQLDKVLILF